MTQENDALPELRITVTKKMIIMGASTSRDWQPIHHDSEYARDHAALPDIIMNNYTQAGWLSHYITAWTGPEARLSRLRFAMRSPLCPGDKAVFTGEVKHRESRDSFVWLTVAVAIHVGERLATQATVCAALPGEKGQSPWHCEGANWKP